MKQKFGYLGLIMILFFGLAAGCGTTGKKFDETKVDRIVNGSTTRDEVEQLFGPPFKKGILNGKDIWIYEYNQYHSLGPDISKDMVIVFDDSGVVQSHQFMTSEPTTQ